MNIVGRLAGPLLGIVALAGCAPAYQPVYQPAYAPAYPYAPADPYASRRPSPYEPVPIPLPGPSIMAVPLPEPRLDDVPPLDGPPALSAGPSDAVTDLLLTPLPQRDAAAVGGSSGGSATAAPAVKIKPPVDSGPFMGFRPMRGQTPPSF